MEQEVKKYESKIKVNTFMKKYLLIPCVIINWCMLAWSISVGSQMLLFWAISTVFNTINLIANIEITKLYKSQLDSLAYQTQIQRVRELNPHKK